MDTRELDQQKTARTPQANGAGTAAVEEPEDTDLDGGRKRPSRRIILIVVAAIVIVAAIVWGIPWLTYMLSHEGTDDAHVAADVVAVTSKIPERINKILVDTNQQVHKGQLLVVLDNKDELARLRQAQAQYDLAVANQRATTTQGQGGVAQAGGAVASSRAQVPMAQDAVAQANAQLLSAQAQVPAAQSAYDKAQSDYRRVSSLVNTGDVAPQQLDAVRAQSAGAAAQLRAAENQVSVAEANVAASQSRVTASSAGGQRSLRRANDGPGQARPSLRSQSGRSRCGAALPCKTGAELHPNLRLHRWLYRPKERGVGTDGRRRLNAHDDRSAQDLHHRQL